jgi:O-antigen/teichoic acid export membrane protein
MRPRRRHRGFGTDAALSLGGSAVGAVVTLATLPYIVDHLGLPRYGLLALVAVATAYVGILDFGFSWTSSRFIASALETRDEQMLSAVVRASLWLYLVLGVGGALFLVLAAGPLVSTVFGTPQSIRGEGIDATRILGVGFTFAMLQTYASAVLRGARRFDLGAALQAAATTGSSLAMVAALALDDSLVAAAVALAATQALGAALGLAAARHAVPGSLTLGSLELPTLRRLASFSLKVAVSNLGLQLLYLPNRLAVGIVLSVGAAGVFTVPTSLAQRLLIVPSALVSAALPTLTAAHARNDLRVFRATFWRLNALSAFLLLPPALLAGIWAPQLLRVWFSPAFGADAAWVLRCSLAAVLLNAVASSLVVACDSVGAPGLPAAAAVSTGFVNVALAFVFAQAWGIVGAAAGLALSLGLLVAIVGGLWRTRRLPPLRLELSAGAAIDAAKAVAVLGALVTLAILFRPLIHTRTSVVLLGLLGVALAYSALAATSRQYIAARRGGEVKPT